MKVAFFILERIGVFCKLSKMSSTDIAKKEMNKGKRIRIVLKQKKRKQNIKKLKTQAIKYWNKLSNIGIGEDFNSLEQQKIRLLNQIVGITAFIQVLSVLQPLFLWQTREIGIAFFTLFLGSLPLWLNYLNKTKLGLWFFCFYGPLNMVCMTILYGVEIQVSYSYIVFSVYLIIFLSTIKERLIFAFFVAAVYSASFYYTEHYASPLAREFNFLEKNTIFVACLLFLILVLKSYTELVEANFNKIQTLLKEQIDGKNTIEIQNEKLLQANVELEKFAYIASHDLKSPLRNISGFLSLMERKIKRGEIEDLLEDLGFAKRASQQMYKLIEDILRFSRMREQELSFELICMNDIITAVMYNLQTDIENKHVEIICETLPKIEINPQQTILLFQNLIENGVKYNKTECPIIKIKSKTEGAFIVLSVEDNGIGIASDYRDKVFEMFARLHNQQDYEGTGLGLAICKRIVQAHHGDIWMDSEEGKGTTFYVKLPIKQDKIV